ncbi:hypothetical protein O7622_18360 [Micromonospora sp. WMMD1076]|uniref:hypothetical protein n=1 Tax=Micromonospora sp. WMMD1076 TaxID=3016103 RepID=UPI00249B4AF0|nr:hypothetical protein [Micromonospora sp. WMMD1076]WFF05025.1 hypothetical protein O7622_18360 [Micromonospora sp. WMMD1076]
MTAQATPVADSATPSPWSKVFGAAALLTVIISVLLTAFAWPSVRSSVHHVPIAVAGPPAAVQQVAAALETKMPDAFAITAVADTDAAERLILDRDVYGAIDLTSGAPQIITASAASAAVAQTLQNVGTALGRAPTPDAGSAPAVRDLVALTVDDPRGTGLAAAALPLVMSGMLAAVLLTQLVRGTGRRITGALIFAVTGALAITAILQFWFGSLAGTYLINVGAVSLTIAATSLTLLGLESLLGLPGLGLGSAIMMLIGNPLSGTGTAPEMLPGWSGALGQLLPPGAGSQLLRSTAFFDGHGSAHSIIVLTTWLAVGVALCVTGGLRGRRATKAALPEPAVPVGAGA